MKEIKAKNDVELTMFLVEKREELRVFRFGTAGSKVRDVRSARKTRRNIARALTEINMRSVTTQ